MVWVWTGGAYLPCTLMPLPPSVASANWRGGWAVLAMTLDDTLTVHAHTGSQNLTLSTRFRH